MIYGNGISGHKHWQQALGLSAIILVTFAVTRLRQNRQKTKSTPPRAKNCDDTTGGCDKVRCHVCEWADIIEETGTDRPVAEPFMGPVYVFGRDLSGHQKQFKLLKEKGILKFFTFFGCDLGDSEQLVLDEGTILTRFRNPLPFEPYREKLYTIDELYEGFDPDRPEETYPITRDALIYKDFVMTSTRPRDFNEALGRRLHDACITEAMNHLFKEGKHVCAIMGGHKLPRGAQQYRDAAKIARRLTQAGIMVCSGGGPGAMEACNLGVWFANRSDDELNDAIDLLAHAPLFNDREWLPTAYRVRAKYPLIHPSSGEVISLGVPTFFYGHEPPNMFQTHVAKFFANSVREDALLSMAFSGILYFPGSAGTVQELFQDGCQNHYEVFGFASPMIFMDIKFWTETVPAYTLLKTMSKGKNYDKLIFLHDDPEEAIKSILDFHHMRRPLLTSITSAPRKAGA